MSEHEQRSKGRATEELAKHAEQSSSSIVGEFISFLSHNKKWWLVPILVVLLLVGIIVVVGGGAAAPFIYTLF